MLLLINQQMAGVLHQLLVQSTTLSHLPIDHIVSQRFAMILVVWTSPVATVGHYIGLMSIWPTPHTIQSI